MGFVMGIGEGVDLHKEVLKTIWICVGKGLNWHIMEFRLNILIIL